uniref:Uncharacterized protein n=1 Tax=Anguilla anguilla TaxID=7936 RepID=A0A0E9REC3_ANGAN
MFCVYFVGEYRS